MSLCVLYCIVRQHHTFIQANLHFVELDVTSDESVKNAVAETSNATDGQIDVLVNNAGEGLNGGMETVSLERAKQHFEVNLWGCFRMVQAVAPVMRERGAGGQIVNISRCIYLFAFWQWGT